MIVQNNYNGKSFFWIFGSIKVPLSKKIKSEFNDYEKIISSRQIFDKKISKKILRTYLFSKNREKQPLYSEIILLKLHFDRFEKL